MDANSVISAEEVVGKFRTSWKFLLGHLLLLPVSLYAQGDYLQSFSQHVATHHPRGVQLPPDTVLGLRLSDQGPIVLHEDRQTVWVEGKWVTQSLTEPKVAPASQAMCTNPILSRSPFKGGEAVGRSDGLYLRFGPNGSWHRALPADDRHSWALQDVRVLTQDKDGRLWFGAKQGIGCWDGQQWSLLSGSEGLPFNDFTCVAAGPSGEVWFGTTRGAIMVKDGRVQYRHSRRWLLDDHVIDIAIDPAGTAWIATSQGISEISGLDLDLEQKAVHFIQQVEDRHNRMGFVCQSRLTERFDVSSSQLAISDNDGLYTAMYGAAQAFRYATTGDLEARALAVRSFKACKWLVDITHEPGFPARVIIPIDWPEDVNKIYSRAYNKRHQQSDPFWKDIYPRFPKSKDGKFRWKCDTSSDELAGHYFFYGIFYDLIAETEEEKQWVREVVADITDHLVRHDFMLNDHDGKPTRWGNFGPKFFQTIWGWEQRGLNSMMMLSFLNVAKHVTGDPKYDETAAYLREKHRYHINALESKMYFPPDNVVPWDNNLCLMSMYGLIKYEQDPALLLMYRMALENAWLHISKQQNAFWDGLYGALVQVFGKRIEEGFFEAEDIFSEHPLLAGQMVERYGHSSLSTRHILQTLRRIPLDLIGYPIDNTHRLDITLDPTPGQDPDMGWGHDGYALPIDERGHVRLDRDGFALKASEGGGYSEHEGTFYLLPYYLALHHNLLP